MKLKLSTIIIKAIPKNDLNISTLQLNISTNDLYTIKKLKKKATANDSLSNKIIKLVVKTSPSYFTSLFNTILSQGKFPFSWTESFIVPIYKSGDASDPNNYSPRGICLSSCLGKLFTLILNPRLIASIKKYNRLL